MHIPDPDEPVQEPPATGAGPLPRGDEPRRDATAARAFGLGAWLVPIPFLILFLASGAVAPVVMAFVLPIPLGLLAIVLGVAGMRGTAPDPGTRAGAIAGLITGAGMVGPDPGEPAPEALSAEARARRHTAVSGIALGVSAIAFWALVAVVAAGIVAGAAGTD